MLSSNKNQIQRLLLRNLIVRLFLHRVFHHNPQTLLFLFFLHLPIQPILHLLLHKLKHQVRVSLLASLRDPSDPFEVILLGCEVVAK